MTAGLLTAVLAAIVSFAVTWLVYRNASGLGLVQSPNERSSHTRPTPSGGGVGIVLGGAVGGVPLALAAPWPFVPILVLSLAIAVMGVVDDRVGLPASRRLVVQLLLCAALVAFLPYEAVAEVLGLSAVPVLAAFVLTFAAVYWINIFNFMDGIDGLAASQAIFMVAGAALLVFHDAGLVWWMLAVGAAALGFLVLNWPPAKIFMGDAGSTWLGFVIAALAIWTVALGWLSIWQWLLLGALFLTDSTVTLVRRALRREPVFKAHRLHAYQHLSRRWGSHRRVTLLAIAVNLVLLLPLAWFVGAVPVAGPVATAAAYAVLFAGILWAGAGAPEAARTAS